MKITRYLTSCNKGNVTRVEWLLPGRKWRVCQLLTNCILRWHQQVSGCPIPPPFQSSALLYRRQCPTTELRHGETTGEIYLFRRNSYRLDRVRCPNCLKINKQILSLRTGMEKTRFPVCLLTWQTFGVPSKVQTKSFPGSASDFLLLLAQID